MEFSADLDIEKLLNLFIANEYFAWKQYFMAKVVAKGDSLKYSNSVFSENGNEELDEHFKELVDYAQSLDIDVEINPNQMEKNASAPYKDLKSSQSTKELVKILIDDEKRAIDEYEKASEGNAAKEYPSLRFMFAEMAKDERLHLKELVDLLSDIDANEKTSSTKKDEHSKNDEDDKKVELDADKSDKEEKNDDKKENVDSKEESSDKKESDKDENDEQSEDDEELDKDENPKTKERKIGKDFDMAKAFKDASKSKKDKKDDNDESVNESVVGRYFNCEQIMNEAFAK